MKILLSHGYFLGEDEKEQRIMKPYPPLGLLYISAWLDKFEISNQIYDTTFSSKQKFQEYLLDQSPDVLALYTNLMTKLNILEIIDFVKSELEDCLVVLGGPDVRYNAENYCRYGADIVVVGEGEQTMKEIIETLDAGYRNEFAHIRGIAYLYNNMLVTTPERERIRPIDDLPLPARGKIDLAQYLDVWKKYHGKSSVTISTQRGCPYTCKWCSTAVYGQSYRRRSPEAVVEEIRVVQDNYQPDSFWFVDDVFTVSHNWLNGFRDELQRQNMSLSYECITRADRMNEDVIKALKESGCYRVWIGAESGSQKVIDLMDRRVDVAQVKSMIQLVKSYGIEAGTFIMLGYPGETEEDIVKTVQYLKEANPDHFTITIAYPIKGTTMYEDVEALQIEKLDWSQTTDRDRDFKRTYPREYYTHAVRWVENEVRSSGLLRKKVSLIKVIKMKLKAKISQWRMRISK